jgi:hypothetical protein
LLDLLREHGAAKRHLPPMNQPCDEQRRVIVMGTAQTDGVREQSPE